MSETQGTGGAPESPDNPAEERGGYADVEGGQETTEQTGGQERDVESDAGNVDAGGKAHTSSSDGHPAGDGERSDRDVGGPRTGA
jgi:hypothetical protein